MSELRLKKVESLIKEKIGNLINRQIIKDPRVETLATVTRVKVSSDLKYSKVYISFYGETSRRRRCVEALNHAAGFIQKELGSQVHLRFIPKLTFLEDSSIEQGFRVTQKIREIMP